MVSLLVAMPIGVIPFLFRVWGWRKLVCPLWAGTAGICRRHKTTEPRVAQRTLGCDAPNGPINPEGVLQTGYTMPQSLVPIYIHIVFSPTTNSAIERIAILPTFA